MEILQKQDLASASFANDNTNAAGGLAVRTDASSTVGAAITAATPDATTAVKGLVELATDAETNSLAGSLAVTPSGFKTTLAADTGASLIGWQQVGPGSVLRTQDERNKDTVHIEDFGAVGDGVTDDTAAFIACLKHNPTAKGFDVLLQAKTYKINTSALYFTRQIRFFGSGRAFTKLDFSTCTDVVNAPYNAHIIFVHSNNITGTSAAANPITLPAGWIGNYGEMGGLFDMEVKCNPAVVDGIGVFYNVAANSSNILVRNANLHNIVFAAQTADLLTRGGTTGPSGLGIGGNTNNGVYINLKAQAAVNGDGIHVSGSDANANLFLHPDAVANKGWGINDRSSLGGCYVQMHTSYNSYGACRTSGSLTNRSTLIAPYAESGQGVDNGGIHFELSSRSTSFGGQGISADGVTGTITSELDGLVARNTISVMNAADTEDSGGTYGRLGRGLVELRSTDGLKFEIKRFSVAYTGLFYNNTANILFPNVTNGALNSTRPYFVNGFALSTAHAQTAGAAAPTTGTWQVGNIVWSNVPTAGGNVGWVCTTAGTPGTWKTFGAIAA